MNIEDIQKIEDGKVKILFVDEKVNPVMELILEEEDIFAITRFCNHTLGYYP